MFSDRLRVLKMIVIAGLIVVLGWWAHRSVRDPVWVDYLARPEKYHGRTVTVAREARIVSVDSTRLVVTQPEGNIELLVPPGFELPSLPPGRDVSALAVFDRDGFFTLEAISASPFRKWKIVVSLLTALAVVLFLFFSIRVGKGGLALKE